LIARRQSTASEDELRTLDARRTSPYAPEAPRKSVIVNAFMTVARISGKGQLVTPHLHGGSNRAKVQWEYERADEFWQVVRDFITPAVLRDKDVLDVGCGWGGKAIRYAETTGLKTITGFDLPGVFDVDVPASFARERGVENAFFTVARGERMPFPDESFDVVIMDDVLEHVADPMEVLGECCRLLRSGGLLIARFPSIRMLKAHHFDRAIGFPGLHYLLPMRTWAAGLNHFLLHNRHGVAFEPFSRVVSTMYRRAVTENLNGLDFKTFSDVARRSGLRVQSLGLAGYPREKFGGAAPVLHPVYELARRVPFLRESLSRSIVFVGADDSQPPFVPG
jgi:ubiquinone/menaquinone biosynthesis C-methylase UbiE